MRKKGGEEDDKSNGKDGEGLGKRRGNETIKTAIYLYYESLICMSLT